MKISHWYMLSKRIKMKNIYSEILKAKAEQQKLLAILLDPDKIVWEGIDQLLSKINQSPATHVFIGGSLVFSEKIDELILKIKASSNLPVVLFPGSPSQISNHADGILFLSLISGRNSDYLIEHQVKAAPILKKSNLEIIPTGYILIESGNETAVAKVSQTLPISRNNRQEVLDTAQAGEMLGNKLIYLEAGSGARLSIPAAIIQLVSQNIEIPLIVGGGIKSKNEIELAYASGADLVVIGTAFEKDNNFFNLNL